MRPNDPQFLRCLDSLGPKARREWEQADEVGRVALSLAITKKVRAKLGDEAARTAFRVLFAVATS